MKKRLCMLIAIGALISACPGLTSAAVENKDMEAAVASVENKKTDAVVTLDEPGMLPHPDETPVMSEGWNLIEDEWFWYEDGNPVHGWKKVSNKWYYMDPDTAVMQTGFITDEFGGYYYCTDNGDMLEEGWHQILGQWYYMHKSGAIARNGWIQPNGRTWYYLDRDGVMATGWRKIHNVYYYMSSSGAMQTGWQFVNGKWYYLNESGSMISGGWKKYNSRWYYLENSGAMATGWKYIGGYKYYFNANGDLVQDVSGLIGAQSSYYITVNRAKCQIMVYASEGGQYIIPVKTFTCSVGLAETPTITGTYSIPNKFRWLLLVGPSYGQYCTQISGDYLFHSVPSENMTSYGISATEYNKLGSPASHGCVRLNVRDAKWIYDNCGLGTTVTISDTVYTPFDKPEVTKIPAGQNWDPTDPNI